MAHDREGKFWLGMLIGAATGAVSALLFTPKSGAQMRQDISDTAREAGHKAGAAWGDVKDRTASAASGVRDRVQSAVSKGRERLDQAMEAGMEAAEQKRREMEGETRQPDIPS